MICGIMAASQAPESQLTQLYIRCSTIKSSVTLPCFIVDESALPANESVTPHVLLLIAGTYTLFIGK
jgi:hypothetical protein